MMIAILNAMNIKMNITPGTINLLFMDIVKRKAFKEERSCHIMRPEGACNEAINTSSIEAIMKQQWYKKFAIMVNQELDVIIKAPKF